MLELEAHVAGARRRTEPLTVGDSFAVLLDPGIDETEVEFSVPPDGVTVRESAQATATGLEARLPMTAVPGGYAARWRRLDGTPVERLAAVAIDPDEGRLATAPSDELRRTLAGVSFAMEAADALDPGAGPSGSQPLMKQLLLGLIGVLLLEQLVAFLAGYHVSFVGRGRPAGAAS
jgi:hypothetical protein